MDRPAAPLALNDLDHAHAVVGARWEQLRERHILLTGGTGFVGKWLLATLIDANARLALRCRVTVLTRHPQAFAARHTELAHAPGVELLEADVRDFSADGSFSHVIHAATDVVATQTPEATFETCVFGTRRVLEVAERAAAQAVLLISSGAVYGTQPPEQAALPEDWNGAPDTLRPTSAYGEGKRAAEWLASACAARSGIRIATARCFAFVGAYLPLEKQFAIGNFIRDAMANRPIVIQGDGTPFRSYLHGSDMAAWLWTVLLAGRTQTAYNVGGEEALSIADLATRVVAALGSSAEIRILKRAEPGAAAARYIPDVHRIRSELQLRAPLDLDESIRRTAQWHQTGHTHT